ncbi:MAG: transposase, partial [Rhodanobacter sp.]
MWEGRYKACLVDSESYLLRCYRYIELNPLRARMVPDPADYRWSSFACNVLAVADPLIRPHSSYVSLGRNEVERCSAYKALVEQVITPTSWIASDYIYNVSTRMEPNASAQPSRPSYRAAPVRQKLVGQEALCVPQKVHT